MLLLSSWLVMLLLLLPLSDQATHFPHILWYIPLCPDHCPPPSLQFAAIVSSSVSNNTLLYMNTQLADRWNGPMLKSTFLKCEGGRVCVATSRSG